MFQFPYLKSLVKRNDQYKSLFHKTLLWENEQQQQSLNKLKIEEKLENQNEGKLLHWKKVVKSRFECEIEVKEKTEELDNLEWFKNWDFEDSILRKKPTWDNSTSSIECKICDATFPTRRLLSQHKRLEHFPSWEGGSKDFCYVPYFVEPKRFNLLRGTLAQGQAECVSCERWLGKSEGGVTKRVGPYLEDLRMKIRSKVDEKAEINDTATKSKRGRKCKPRTSRRVCELCSKILSNRKGLERHMLIHTGEKPFPCDICGKPFRRKDNCVRHKKTAHLFKKPRKPRRRKTAIITSNVPDEDIN